MEVGEDVLDPLLVERPLQDPMLTSHQQCWPYRADRNFGRLLATFNTQLAECQVEPCDSCRLMMQIMLWLHAPWPCPLGLCLLMYKPLWWSQWSICWYDFSWCSLWLHKLNLSLHSNVWLDKTFSLVHLGQDGAIPGTVIHSRACDGSWFLAKTLVSGKKDTIFWCWVFPLPNTHLPDATHAWRYDRRRAEASTNRNTVFIIHHLRSMTSS